MHALLQDEGMQYLCMSFARGNPQAGKLGIACLATRRDAFGDEPSRAIEGATLAALAAQRWDSRVSAEYVPQGDLEASLAWTAMLDEHPTGAAAPPGNPSGLNRPRDSTATGV